MISRDERNNYDIKLLRELIQNISFIILLSLICIVLAFISLAENIIIKYISNFITYVLCILFTVTVLMILKRMYIFFDEEITKKLHKPRKLE